MSLNNEIVLANIFFDGKPIFSMPVFTNLSTRNKATEFTMWMNSWNC